MSDQLLIAIIAASAAIIASVGAQIVGGFLSRRAEKHRLKREDHRFELERRDREAERFTDDKRKTFVKYLQLRNEYHRICGRLYLEDHHPQDRVDRLVQRARRAGSDIAALEEAIGLLDPMVYGELRQARDIAVDIRSIIRGKLERYQEWMAEDSATIDWLRLVMRKSLKIKDWAPDDEIDTQI